MTTTTSTLRRRLSAAVATVLAAGGLAALSTTVAAPAAQAADAPLACGESEIVKDLANGASWRMCARIHPIKGLILEQIEYKPPTTRESRPPESSIDIGPCGFACRATAASTASSSNAT